MRIHILLPRFFKTLLVAVAGLALAAGAAQAQAQENVYSHAGNFDLYVIGQYFTGGRIISALGPGFGVGYNFNDHLSVTLEGYAGDLDVKINGQDGVGTTYDAMANVEWKFTTGRWTPYLTAGAGIFNYDARNQEVDPLIYNLASTGIMGGGGGGIYWNITHHWFFKGAFRVWATSCKGISVVYGPTLSAGYSF